MVDAVSTSLTRIYENQSLTVTARIDKSDIESIEEVTFKFLKDGKQFEEKTIRIGAAAKEGGAKPSGDTATTAEDKKEEGDSAESDSEEGRVEETADHAVVSHTVKAPQVDDDKNFYFLDYHYFYKVRSETGTSDTLQSFPASRIQVFSRFARLKVSDKDGKAFPDFKFVVEQDGRNSEVQKTFAGDVPNAKGETIPAGSCEFGLELSPSFRILACPPYRIVEEVVGAGRKREIKGELGFRAIVVAPEKKPTNHQCVDYPVEENGQQGIGHEVLIEVGVHPEDQQYLPSITKPTIHFRVTYGPPADATPAKSERDDTNHPTKVSKPSASDTKVTVEEKEAKKKYQGKVELVEGAGKFLVGLGKAGGDTCKVEISGSADFLTKPEVLPDETLNFENWRRVHYELMVPDILKDRFPEPYQDFDVEEKKVLNDLGRNLFIEFVHDGTRVFEAAKNADYGTLGPRAFFGLPKAEADIAYVLSGRNWRKPPEGVAWSEGHPGKTLYVSACDAIYKWRQDTDDEKAGTTDFSGTLKAATGSLNVEEKFEGYFMPFSGHDAGQGMAGIHWTADISKDDAVCKIKPEITIKEDRYEASIATGLSVTMAVGEGLPALAERVVFPRLPYPELVIVDKTAPADADDGKLTLKDPVVGKELALSFEIPEAGTEEEESSTSDSETSDDSEAEEKDGPILVPFDAMDDDGEIEFKEGGGPESFSDFGAIADSDEEKSDEDLGIDAPVISAEQSAEIDGFFKGLFTDGKAKLGASADANKFTVEISGGKGADHRARRIAELTQAVSASYARTHGHDQYDFKKDLPAEAVERVQGFVNSLLAEKAALGAIKGKAVVVLGCPKDAKHGVDDCFKAVKDKLKELFDATAKEFAAHPGLDPATDFAPREGDLTLAQITDLSRSSVKEWFFTLPLVLPDGTPGPGAFVGPAKSAEQCPVKFELAFQPHEVSPGEADGNQLAWAVGVPNAGRHLASLILQGLGGVEDTAALAHDHGDDGAPGDCVIKDGTLCDKCIAFGRSLNLTAI